MVMSLKGKKLLDERLVMKVKAKELNSFLGIVKTDMARLAVEAFPQEINQKLVSL